MGAAMFSSCGNDHEDLYDPNAAALLKANEYAKAFVQQFGDIDPNHTWGFGNAIGSRGSDPSVADSPDYVKPAVVTSDEIAAVVKYFSENKNPESMPVDWSNYWVQQVSSSAYGSNMDKLMDGNGDHIDSFNQGSYNREGNGSIGMFMKDSKTTGFSYNNSKTSEQVSNLFVIQYINGSYYVGFDFKSEVDGIEADGYYNDWIVKIVPMEYTNTVRIIAEDLGTIGDFDFNDVVFDVKTFGSQWYLEGAYAYITVQAAGGTLPIYIGYNGTEYEVHELFGVSTSAMVNTDSNNEKAVRRGCVSFTLPGCYDISQVYLRVNGGDVDYYLNTYEGEAPQKICVGTDFEWTEERQNIKDKYPAFVNYTGDSSATWY